jgi:tetratricopeptide (TPR) repeat protein
VSTRRRRILIGLGLALPVVIVAALVGWYQVQMRLARIALAERRATQALLHLDRCALIWSGSAEECLLRARTARYLGDADEAERWLRRCQKQERTPSDKTTLEWALLRAENGSLSGVESYLRDLLHRQHPQSVDILESLAVGLLRIYRFHDAVGCLNRGRELDPDNLRLLYVSGRAWERVHAYSRAVEEFEKVVSREPRFLDAQLRLGRMLHETSKVDHAIEHLQQVVDREPDNSDAIVALALALNTRRPGEKQAASLLDQLLGEQPRLASALSARGVVALDAHAFDDAEGWLRQAIELAPFERPAHFHLHRCLQMRGKDDEAKKQLARLKKVEGYIERLIAISNREMPKHPRNPDLHHELGTIMQTMGMEELAVNWFLSALSCDAGHRPSHVALARYYARIGEKDKAAHHEQAAGNEPGTK